MQTTPTQIAMNLGSHGERQQHQASEADTSPEMGLPEHGVQGIVTATEHLRLQAETDHPEPGEQGEAGAVGRLPHTPERSEGDDTADQHKQQLHQASRSPIESEQRLAGRDHHRFSNQNHTHHSSGEPLPEVGVITANSGRQLAVQNTPVPGLLGQAQHHPQQGVDNHDRKRGMDQPQPVNGLHRQRRIEGRTGTASLCSGWPYHFRGAHAMVALNCSHQIRTDP